MKKIERFQITGMTIEGFKSYRETTDLVFGNPTTITGGNGRGKTSIADAIAFAITGQPFFGERGIDKLHNEFRPDVFISLRFVDEAGASHELTRTRHKNRMSIHYDGYEIRQLDLTDMFGERDVFLSIFNPLYFIEELGDDGKNLLEMYLPMISHESVMDRLSEATRTALEGVNILSPDAFLKSKRAEIRELEEHLIYLQGQKDQAGTQAEAQKQAVTALAERHSLLDSELNALENKRFSGLDRAQMEARLVELSACYEEAARSSGSTAKIDAQILALQQKLAQRRAEQYQSQYTQAIVDTSAQVTELGNRYRREAQIMKAFTPGVACPTCRRPVTEQNLSEVQGALQKVIDAIVADGREQQSQLKQLRELDTKAQVVFDQFQSDDIIKMQDEIETLTQQRNKLTEDRQTDGLRGEIQRLSASLEYGNLSQQEYDRLLACREETRQCAAELNAAKRASEQEQPDLDGQVAQDKQEIKELKALISAVWACSRLPDASAAGGRGKLPLLRRPRQGKIPSEPEYRHQSISLQPLRRSRQQRHAVRSAERGEQQTGLSGVDEGDQCVSSSQTANSSKHRNRAVARFPGGTARHLFRYAGAFDPFGQAP